MFRQKVLDRLKSPEDLDNLLVTVSLRNWVLLAVLGTACLGALTWSILGRIPIAVEGFGVLINPGNVKAVQTRAAGQITELKVRPGQSVKAGQVLADVNQPDIVKQLEQKQAELSALEQFNATSAGLDEARKKLVAESLKEQAGFIADEIASAKKLSVSLVEKSAAYSREQQKNLQKSRELTSKLLATLVGRVALIQSLRKEGLTSDDLVLDAETKRMDSETRLATLDAQIQELELKKIEQDREQLDRENRISDLELSLIKLRIQEQELTQELTRNERNRATQRQTLIDDIDRLKVQLREQGQITSQFSGRILEVAVSPGQIVTLGQRVGTIEIDDEASELRNLAYFSVKEGKKVQVGDEVRITPATVERERYGSIIGRVVKVATFPVTRDSVVNVVGNAEIADALMQQGGAIEIEMELDRDANSFSGYRWTSQGPPQKLSSGTTTTVRVTVEERAPITYVLPLLQAWLSGEKDDRQPEF